MAANNTDPTDNMMLVEDGEIDINDGEDMIPEDNCDDSNQWPQGQETAPLVMMAQRAHEQEEAELAETEAFAADEIASTFQQC